MNAIIAIICNILIAMSLSFVKELTLKNARPSCILGVEGDITIDSIFLQDS